LAAIAAAAILTRLTAPRPVAAFIWLLFVYFSISFMGAAFFAETASSVEAAPTVKVPRSGL
jgi:hypothetical protein